MRRFLLVLISGFFLLTFANVVTAVPISYTSEASYLASLSTYAQIFEGFEDDSVWGPSRNPSSATSITSQGITWDPGDRISTIASSWTRSGTYGVYDTYGDPDSIATIIGANTLVGVGGWFNQTTAPNINISIGGNTVATLSLGGSSHQFLGVIDTDGFTSATFWTTAGHWGADDFTFGKSQPVHEPTTMLLLGTGLVGLAGFRRKFRK